VNGSITEYSNEGDTMSDITEAEEIAAVMAGTYVWDKHCARKGADTNRAARLWSRGLLAHQWGC
jgi:hypothetical protein